MKIKVGVIGVQGAVSEHIEAINKALKELGLNGKAFWLRNLGQTKNLNALIIPGGESTTITKLMQKAKLWDFLKEKANQGMPIFGTCAGLIVLAKEGNSEIKKTGQELLNLLNVKVKRNAFGRQRESFEAYLNTTILGKKPFKGVFIRAPIIEKVGKGVEVLAKFGDKIVFVKQGKLLACSFHPELTNDLRIHKYFISLIGGLKKVG